MDDIFCGGIESETENGPVNTDEEDVDKKETNDKTKTPKKTTKGTSKKTTSSKK